MARNKPVGVGGVEMSQEAPRRRERKRYEFLLEAAAPIAHHAETIGNEAIIMRSRYPMRDGWADVPVITGDTMRHGMREAAAWALLDAAGMLNDESTRRANLSEGAMRLLFAGGMVTGKGDAGVISLDRYRELCELVPPMALFGGCCDNRVIPGRLVCEEAQLVCEETHGYVPEWTYAAAGDLRGEVGSCRAHIEEMQRVRMDPSLVPEKRLLLSDEAAVAVNRRLESSQHAHEAEDAVVAVDAKSSMMPRRFERLARGSLFAWACEATCWTELEVDALNVAVCAFLSHAVVGGKRGTGHGLLRVVRAEGVQVERPRDARYPLDVLAPAGVVGKIFRAHVDARRERIMEFFRGVNA
jgi:hypothetical protein